MKHVLIHKSCFGFILMATLVGGPEFAFAVEPVVVDEATTKIPLGLHLEYFEDKDGKLTVEEILRPEITSRFIPSEVETLNFGFTESAYWYWFELKNNQTHSVDRLLEIAWPHLNELDIYLLSQTSERTHFHLGDKLTFSERPVDHRNFLVPIAIPQGEVLRVLIRVQTLGTPRLPLTLWRTLEFFEEDQEVIITQGLYFGLLLVMALYNLFVFVSLKERAYLYYVIFVLSFAGWQAGFQGLSYQYLWPNSPIWHQAHSNPLIFTALISASLFANAFLELRRYAKMHFRLISLIVGLVILTVTLSFFLPKDLVDRVKLLLCLFGCPVLFSAGILRWRQGSIAARYYITAWASFLLGCIAFILSGFGLLPANAFTTNGPQVGSVLEVMLLSLGLARKLKTLSDDNLRIQKQSAKELQGKVDAATAELREQADQLQELDQQKTHFFQNISHELRTPLTLILNPLESLSKELPNNKNAEVAVKNSRRLLRLVNQLLDFQKLEAGKKELRLVPVNLSRFVSVCGDYFADACSAIDIEFLTSLNGEKVGKTPSPVPILGEVDALEKIVFNFLANALKYTPAGGQIELGLTTTAEKVRVFIRDTGPGISVEGKKKLFQLFSQVDESATRGYEGTGLGLALVKSLAEEMAGTVGVESELGEGSTFWAEFSLGDAPSAEEELDFEVKDWFLADGGGEKGLEEDDVGEFATANAPLDSSGEGSGELVLVIDDLRDMRDLVSNCLKKANYRVLRAPNGKRGLEIAREVNPDLVVTDWMMPQMSGPDLIKAIREDDELMGTPIVLLTAKSDEESKLIGTEIGADAFLGKPFSDRELRSTVRNLLGLKLHQKRAIAALKHLQDAQEKLIESEKMSVLSVLVGGIAHEMNTPLATIQLASETMQSLVRRLNLEDVGWNKRFNKASLMSTDSIKRLATIIDSLRLYTWPSTEISKTFVIREILERAFTIAESRLDGVPVEIVCDEKLEFCIFPSKLSQVVNSLLVNAADACAEQENSQIKLVAQCQNGSLQISVQDNGTGISEEIKGKIFDPFFTTKRPGKGTGLGLALCKRFTQEMEGSLEFSDENPGTTFRVILNEKLEP